MIFVTVTTDLPKNDQSLFVVTSEGEYTLKGITSAAAKRLYVDGQAVEISPLVYTWEKTFHAPKTGANTMAIHKVEVFGHGTNPNDITHAANIIEILIVPKC